MNQLQIALINRQITIQTVSNVLNLNRNSCTRKLNDPGRFCIEDFSTIQKSFFPEISLNDLYIMAKTEYEEK